MFQAAVSLQEKKIGNHPNISVICLAPNGTQISNKLKSNTAESPNILFKLS